MRLCCSQLVWRMMQHVCRLPKCTVRMEVGQVDSACCCLKFVTWWPCRPEVVIVDEIGTEAEALACRSIAERGVQLVGTAHGQLLENLIKVSLHSKQHCHGHSAYLCLHTSLVCDCCADIFGLLPAEPDAV